MTYLPTQRANSPFDQIKHVDDRGENWSGRELQGLVEYEQWRNFEAAILKARESIAEDQGETAAREHIADASKMVPTGSGAERSLDDYRLTRHGAYRVLQECDGRKPRIAEAKHYFAARTEEAELVDEMDKDLRLIVEGAKAIQETRRELRQVQLVQHQHGVRLDQAEARVATIEGDHDYVSALGYANLHPPLCKEQTYLSRVGKVATRIANEQGVRVGKTKHPYYGQANTYPEDVLKAAFAEVGSK